MNNLISLSQELLNFSLLFSAQLLLLLIIRTSVARWFGANNAYWLWLLPLVWLPFHWLSLPAIDWQALGSLLPVEETPSGPLRGIVSWFPLTLQGFTLDFSLSDINALNSQSTTTASVWMVLSLIWLSGAITLALLQAYRIYHFYQQITPLMTAFTSAQRQALGKEIALPDSLNVATVSGTSSPALFGCVSPVLLLPQDFATRFNLQQRRLILAHELVHFHRRDNAWNLLATVVRILFWFNPLVHLAWHGYRLDQEMSCDELALSTMQGQQGLLYARTLIESAGNMQSVKHQPTLTAWGNLREIRERTHMIKHHTTHTPLYGTGKWLLVLLVLVGSHNTASFAAAPEEPAAAVNEPSATPASPWTDGAAEQIQQFRVLRDQQDYAGAKAILEQLKQDYDAGKLTSEASYELWRYYATLAQLQENYAEALQSYQLILAMEDLRNPQRAETLREASALAYLLGRYEDSIRYQEQFLGLFSKSEDSPQMIQVKNLSRLKIASAYYQLQEYDKAIPYAETIIEARPDYRGTYTFLRTLYLLTGNTQGALQLTQTMVERFDDPSDNDLLSIVRAGGDVMGQPEALRFAGEMEYLPILVTQPKYPIAALQQGTEGWAQVSFTVNELGAVVNPTVVDASPAGVFDQVSLEAIAQFKFDPRLQAGLPVATEGVQYVFRFNMAAN